MMTHFDSASAPASGVSGSTTICKYVAFHLRLLMLIVMFAIDLTCLNIFLPNSIVTLKQRHMFQLCRPTVQHC